MKCKKCEFENIIKASYCHNCGNKFTEEEKKKAYHKTIYGKIEELENVKSIVTLDKITSHIAFRIISLLIVLGIGIYFLLTMGIDTKLLKSEKYEIFYSKEVNEYYLIVDDNLSSVDVSLYRPNRVEKLVIYHYDMSDNLIEEKEIKKEENVNLNTFNDDYYVIKSEYSNKNEQDLKVFVYHNSDI